MGKNPEALKYLQKAYAQSDKISPEAIAEIAVHYGEVLWLSGNKDRAKSVFEKAQTDFPENEKLLRTIKNFLK